MPYSSYSNYLEYKNCKRDTIPCHNNFDSYKKYNRSLSCTRAWWTNAASSFTVNGVANNTTIKNYIMTRQCKSCGDNRSTQNIETKYDPVTKSYCGSIKSCLKN